MEIAQELGYKDFLKKYIESNFISYYKFCDKFSDFVKPSHLSQTLKTNKGGAFVNSKDISIPKWVTWVNALEISKQDKKHLILLRLRDELVKELNGSSSEVSLVGELINQNISKKLSNVKINDLEILNKNRFDGSLFDIILGLGQLNKNRCTYIKNTIKSCMLDEIASKPSIKTIELKRLFKKIF